MSEAGTAHVKRFRHPGSSRKRAAVSGKGRDVEPAAAKAIRELLGERPRRRDLLIEHLHLIQDRFNGISRPHLAAACGGDVTVPGRGL